jgi:hypothetical protein
MVDYLHDDVFGILLVPDAATTQRCIEASRRLDAAGPSMVVLDDETSHAHATVVHVSAGVEQARELWKAVDSLATPVTVEAFSFYTGHRRAEHGPDWICARRTSSPL